MHPAVKKIIKKNSEREWLVEMQDGTRAIWISTRPVSRSRCINPCMLCTKQDEHTKVDREV